jgi:proteasome regulatory subunit
MHSHRFYSSVIQIKSEEKINDAVFSYTADIAQLEEENRVLKEALNQMRSEIEKYRHSPLMYCEVKDLIDGCALIKIPNGNQFLVEISSSCEKIRPGESVLVEQKNLTVIKKIRGIKHFNVQKFVIMEKPTVTWKDIGGLDEQIKELIEVIELPLKKPQLFEKIGISPPKGILLHGPPGTGKTILAKAVANSTNSTFIQLVGSELVQKFIGEGAKLVKEVFALAREKAPSIVFIDELDAIAAKRVELGTSGEREVQRTFMQLLSEIDGFQNLSNVKVIGCTNRKDILDPAVIRPGRLERHIYVPVPNLEARRQIYKIHSKSLKIDTEINHERIISLMNDFSGAEIKAMTTEAGYFAIRENRTKVSEKDMVSAIVKVKQKETESGTEYLHMFG